MQVFEADRFRISGSAASNGLKTTPVAECSPEATSRPHAAKQWAAAASSPTMHCASVHAGHRIKLHAMVVRAAEVHGLETHKVTGKGTARGCRSNSRFSLLSAARPPHGSLMQSSGWRLSLERAHGMWSPFRMVPGDH